MFTIEVVVSGGVVLGCIILKCVSNIHSPLMFVNGVGKTLDRPQYNEVQFNTTANYNINNKHIVK